MDYLFEVLVIWMTMTVRGDYDDIINPTPRITIDKPNFGNSFRDESRTDHNQFAFMTKDGENVLVGAKNAMYNLSSTTLSIENIFYWNSSPNDVEMCLMKGKSEEECQNYIRLFVRQNDDKFIVCSTNAYKPACRQYTQLKDEVHLEREFSGYAIIPYDFATNFTFTYVPENNELYTASVSDFSGTDSLIYKKPLGFDDYSKELRTPRNDFKCLNEPNFVSTFDDNEYVYFWFRENALESTSSDKTVYSRVARVCKSDKGGLRNHFWTSFVKARLNCSLSGDVPFYLNELLSTAISGKFVYAIFSTPRNGIRASAICVYSIDDIRNVLNNGTFKIQPTVTSLWLPVMKQALPNPRPGSCVKNTKTLSNEVVNFIQKNSLIHEVVQNYYNHPIFIRYNLKSQLTNIIVRKETALNKVIYDTLFVGTDDGRVMKLVNIQSQGHKPNAVLVADMQIFDSKTVVSGLQFTSNKLLIMSANEIQTIPLCYCHTKSTCSSCVMLQDPCCAWNPKLQTCTSVYSMYEFFVRSNEDEKSKPSILYNGENLAITVTLTLIVSSAVGFLIGYKFAKWKTLDEYDNRSCSSSNQNHLYPIKSTAPLMENNNSECSKSANDGKKLIMLNNLQLSKGYKTKLVYL